MSSAYRRSFGLLFSIATSCHQVLGTVSLFACTNNFWPVPSPFRSTSDLKTYDWSLRSLPCLHRKMQCGIPQTCARTSVLVKLSTRLGWLSQKSNKKSWMKVGKDSSLASNIHHYGRRKKCKITWWIFTMLISRLVLQPKAIFLRYGPKIWPARIMMLRKSVRRLHNMSLSLAKPLPRIWKNWRVHAWGNMRSEETTTHMFKRLTKRRQVAAAKNTKK